MRLRFKPPAVRQGTAGEFTRWETTCEQFAIEHCRSYFGAAANRYLVFAVGPYGWRLHSDHRSRRAAVKALRRLAGAAAAELKKEETTTMAKKRTAKKKTAAPRTPSHTGAARKKAAATTAPPRATKRRKTAEAEAAPAKKLSCLAAAAQVLAAAGEPMTVRQMLEAVTAQGLWASPSGKTPEATLYAAIIREIANKGTEARFQKVDRGLFAAA